MHRSARRPVSTATSSSTTDDQRTATLRTDAERNRQRIVEAAQELFAHRGLDVPLEHIARHAGVGIATLYRRFPNRTDLVAATFERTIGYYARIVDRARADPDPWHGFSTMITELCALQAADAALRDLMTMSFPEASVVEALRVEVGDNLWAVIAAARDQGTLRADFDISDIGLLLLANAGVVTATRLEAPTAWRRFAAYMIQSFRADAAQPLPDPPTEEQLTRSLLDPGGRA